MRDDEGHAGGHDTRAGKTGRRQATSTGGRSLEGATGATGVVQHDLVFSADCFLKELKQKK